MFSFDAIIIISQCVVAMRNRKFGIYNLACNAGEFVKNISIDLHPRRLKQRLIMTLT